METITAATASATVDVDAPPEAVWAVVSDVTRIPEWSPVCYRCEWLGEPRTAVVGARFRGHNRLNGVRWARDCVVSEATPAVALSFSTLFRGRESTRWRYLLERTDGGTRVTEAYQVVSMPGWVRLLRLLPGAAAKSDRDTRRNLEVSLERLKLVVEGAARS